MRDCHLKSCPDATGAPRRERASAILPHSNEQPGSRPAADSATDEDRVPGTAAQRRFHALHPRALPGFAGRADADGGRRLAGLRGHAPPARPRPDRVVAIPAVRAADPAGRAFRGHPRPPAHHHRLLRPAAALRAAAARILVARPAQRVARVRRHDAVRRRPRLRHAGEPGPVAEPGRPGALRHRRRLQLVAVAGVHDRRDPRSVACSTSQARPPCTQPWRSCWPCRW